MSRRFLSLKSKRDFSHVFRRGLSGRSTHLRVLWLRSPGPQSRWGIVVSKKVSKLAVVRNRIRRQLKGSLDLLAHTEPISAIIQVLRLPPLGTSIAEELQTLLKRTRVPGV